MTTNSRLEQLPEYAMSEILSYLPLPDQERLSQASAVANQTLRSSSFHEFESNLTSKRYNIIGTTRIDVESNRLLLLFSSNYEDAARLSCKGKYEEQSYLTKSSESFTIQRGNQNDLTVTLSRVNQTIALPLDIEIYDFAINFESKIFAVSTSKGLQIYALEAANSSQPKMIAEFAQFRFCTMYFDRNTLIGIEPVEQLFSYSSQWKLISFEAPNAKTHLLDNRILYGLREGARKVGLFALRAFVTISCLATAIVAASALFSGFMTLLHVTGVAVLTATATGVAFAASQVFLLIAVIAGGILGALCIPVALYLGYRAAVLTFGEPEYLMSIGSFFTSL